MGIYAEYLDKGFNSADLNRERKKQLGRIAQLRQRRGRGVRYPATTISIGTDRTAATTPTPRVLPAGRRGCPERVAGRTARR